MSLADELRRFNEIRRETLPRGLKTLAEEDREQIEARARLEAELAQVTQEQNG